MTAGVESLGTTSVSATTFATKFQSGRHDGAAATRMFAFVDSCTCFQCTGAPRPII